MKIKEEIARLLEEDGGHALTERQIREALKIRPFERGKVKAAKV